MKIKKYIKQFFLLLIIPLIYTDCQKLFKEDEQNTLDLNNIDDLAKAIAGLNYRFAYSIVGTQFYYLISFINSDDLAVVNSYYGWGNYCVEMLDIHALENYKGPDYFWTSLYQTVASANSILDKSRDLNMNNPRIKNMIGEVYFMRAYTYFRLTRYFGQVPIIDDININYTVKKAEFNEVYNFIISDLQNAIEMLPGSNSDARIKYVTPHRGTAKSLLAEVYLTMGGYPLKQTDKYALAAATAKEVIDSASYFGYYLLPDLADLWNGRQILNGESVYSLYFRDVGYYTNVYENPNDNYDGENLDFWPFTVAMVGIRIYNNFPPGYRKNMTYRSPRSPESGWYNDTTRLPENINVCNEGQIIFRKFYNPFLSVNLNLKKGRVVYLLRYARTLLTYAEAKARSGNADVSAYEALNEVRRRANKVDLLKPSKFDLLSGLSAEQFADSVVNERAFEFCGEPESRCFDILRLEMMGQLSKLKFPNQGPDKPELVDPSTYFIPIPEEDKKLNPNLK